ncbi:MAG: hypothetical protein Q8Q09_18225 [Deltaproteobacteria bacterium]|nr:hypothetical protein [Deltaproteobacteria bacterium]
MATDDLLETILRGTPSELQAARARVADSRGKGDRGVVARVERAVSAAPRDTISFDPSGHATVRAGGEEFSGGVFKVRSIASLREAVVARSDAPTNSVRLSVLEGQDAVTDIGALQAMAPTSTLFQAASQFNCLESPGAYLARVTDYLSDPTQGPRASISAFPATLVRHYAAPDEAGGRFVQSAERQLDLLANALPSTLGRVESGYLQTKRIADLPGAARALEERFEQIAVGVHDEAQVVLGHAWDGGVDGEPRIAQVFTSTLAAGGYGGGEAFGGALETMCRQLLRAAYLGTLLAALDLGKRRVVLTMIGGGVFANPHTLICECVLWAIEEVERMGRGELEVVLNARDLSRRVDRVALRNACEQRGGVLREL